MKTPLFASLCTYHGAPSLTDELVKRENDLKAVLSPIRGFHSYYLIKTADGAVSMTVCNDRAGTDESNKVAATWLKDNLPTFAGRTPEITSGEVRVQLEPEFVKATL